MEEKDFTPSNWLLWELEDQISDNDYLAWAVFNIPNLIKQDDIFYMYNQGVSLDCTLYASMTALWSTMNYKFTEQDIKEVRDLAVKMWKVREDWRYLFKWIDCVRNRWNTKFPDNKVMSIQVETKSNAKEYWDKGYFIATTFKGNKAYWIDKNNNWIVEWVDFRPSSFWHAINTKKNGYIFVVDNYFGNKYNIYWLKNYEELIKNNVFSSQGYVFLATTDKVKEETKRKSRLLILLKEIITLTTDKEFIKDCKTKIEYINKTI